MTSTSHQKTVSLDELIYDPKVQRAEGTDQRRVAKMAAEFDPDALGTIICSLRANGTLAVLDGGHRWAAAKLFGWTEPLDAKVFVGLTTAEEAGLFLLYNNKKDPSAISRFLLRVVAGDEVASGINDVLGKHQWTVSPDPRPGALAAINKAEEVYRTGCGTLPAGQHADLLDSVLDIITAAWEWETGSADGSMLAAVAQLMGRYGSAVDRNKLVREMQGTRPKVLIGRARSLRDFQGGTVPAALAKILAGMHNNKKRTNLLPDWVWIR